MSLQFLWTPLDAIRLLVVRSHSSCFLTWTSTCQGVKLSQRATGMKANGATAQKTTAALATAQHRSTWLTKSRLCNSLIFGRFAPANKDNKAVCNHLFAVLSLDVQDHPRGSCSLLDHCNKSFNIFQLPFLFLMWNAFSTSLAYLALELQRFPPKIAPFTACWKCILCASYGNMGTGWESFLQIRKGLFSWCRALPKSIHASHFEQSTVPLSRRHSLCIVVSPQWRIEGNTNRPTVQP